MDVHALQLFSQTIFVQSPEPKTKPALHFVQVVVSEQVKQFDSQIIVAAENVVVTLVDFHASPPYEVMHIAYISAEPVSGAVHLNEWDVVIDPPLVLVILLPAVISVLALFVKLPVDACKIIADAVFDSTVNVYSVAAANVVGRFFMTQFAVPPASKVPIPIGAAAIDAKSFGHLLFTQVSPVTQYFGYACATAIDDTNNKTN